MRYLLYNSAVRAAAPVGALWLRAHARHRPLLARFEPPVPPLAGAPLWVQACSVGEVGVARALLHAMGERFPAYPRLLTASTLAGFRIAQTAGNDIAALTWFPFDTPGAVRRFLGEARPAALVLIETELWPNVLRACAERGVPVLVVNGRISARHYQRYQRLRVLARSLFTQLTAVGAQDETHAARFRELGTPAACVHVTGNTKFDAVPAHVPPHTRQRLRAENGLGKAPVLVFGSTRPGDEALAAACWRTLRDAFPALRLVIAPRHGERLREAMAPFAGEAVLLRSAVKAGHAPAGERVLFLDTVGELVSFYSLADAAVIGGSFYPGVEGHNPLEPAALGVPAVFGPHMDNFAEPARTLLQAQGAKRVYEVGALSGVLHDLLGDATLRRNMGTRARKCVLDNQGATGRNLELLAGLIGPEVSASVTSHALPHTR
ncbi:MAG: 3-deoxy-D-manno-octulosonic acid transferase [Candidatus Hydrogenedentota bacterium]